MTGPQEIRRISTKDREVSTYFKNTMRVGKNRFFEYVGTPFRTPTKNQKNTGTEREGNKQTLRRTL